MWRWLQAAIAALRRRRAAFELPKPSGMVRIGTLKAGRAQTTRAVSDTGGMEAYICAATGDRIHAAATPDLAALAEPILEAVPSGFSKEIREELGHTDGRAVALHMAHEWLVLLDRYMEFKMEDEAELRQGVWTLRLATAVHYAAVAGEGNPVRVSLRRRLMQCTDTKYMAAVEKLIVGCATD